MSGGRSSASFAAMPDSEHVTVSGDNPPEAERLIEALLDYGATRILAWTNDSTGETSIDFESPLPGEAPQRASVTMRRGQIEQVTLRLGVLDAHNYEGHPTDNPIQVRRLVRLVQPMDVPGGSLVVNYGDGRYTPRPHILINWVPGAAEHYGIVRKEPFEAISVEDFVAFLRDATEAVRGEFSEEFVGPEERMVHWQAQEDIPEGARPSLETDLADKIHLYYVQNRRKYARVWENLDRTRSIWQRVSKRKRETMLKMSYVLAVLSIQDAWERAENVYDDMIGGAGISRTWKNKEEWLAKSMPKTQTWRQAVDLIDMGNINTADTLLRAEVTGIATAKAPWTMAQLGFVTKMCIDSNVQNLLDIDGDELDNLNVDQYEAVCADILDLLPDMADILRPYEMQWVLFDYNRFRRDVGDPLDPPEGEDPVADHASWFRHISNVDQMVSTSRRLTVESERYLERNEIELPRA